MAKKKNLWIFVLSRYPIFKSLKQGHLVTFRWLGCRRKFLTPHVTKKAKWFINATKKEWQRQQNDVIKPEKMKKYNQDITNTQTLSSLIFLYLSVPNPSQSQSRLHKIANLHIFLSLLYSFLLGTAWWLSYSYWRFLPQDQSKNVCMSCQK
jgi:hypothetical protein